MSDAIHDKFLERLRGSEEAVQLAARWLKSLGQGVIRSPASEAPSHFDWKKHSDSGDLYVLQRVEVKHLTRKFTCAEDYPFKRMFVCAKGSFDRAWPKPHMHIIFSSDLRAAAIIRTTTKPQWTVVTKRDERFEEKDIFADFYTAPLSAFLFVPVPMEEEMKEEPPA